MERYIMSEKEEEELKTVNGLRDKAIMEIKKLEDCNCEGYHEGCDDAGLCVGRYIIDWIKDFFNITDDELKEK